MSDHPQDKAVRSLLHRLCKTHELIWAHDGEELVKLSTMKASEAKRNALDVITSVDDSHLRVRNKESQKCTTMFIVLGNENCELVADWAVGDELLDTVISDFSEYWENK